MTGHTNNSGGFFARFFASRPEPTKYPADLPSAGPALDSTAEAPLAPAPPEFAADETPRVDSAAKTGAELADVTSLAELTTMRVGGGFERLLVAETAAELAEHAAALWDSGEDWLLLGGGSNTLVSDAGYPGTVLLVRNTGIEVVPDATLPAGKVRVRVQAGHDWDELVAWSVQQGYAGIEMLSGIPGLAGAAPVQNIGAYGGEVAQVLSSVTWYDRDWGQVREVAAADLHLSYRDSILKQGYEAVILSLDLVLQDNSAQPEPQSQPVVFPQLAKALEVRLGATVPLTAVRRAVLQVRARKGMVLNEADHNSWSCGSFFTNPIVTEKFARTLPADAPRFAVQQQRESDLVTTFEELAAGEELRLQGFGGADAAGFGGAADAGADADYGAAAPGAVAGADAGAVWAEPRQEPQVKLSAAWLIEHAGVRRGFRLPGSGAAVSDFHTLAITNRGGASAADVAELARYIVSMVQTEFGVILVPEPNIYGLEV